MNESKQKMEALASEVAKHLPGWRAKPYAGKEPDWNENWGERLIGTDGLVIALKPTDFKRGEPDRLRVSAEAWPKYTVMEHTHGLGDQVNTKTIQPSSLYVPRESVESISVSISRGPKVIAGEIARRLIPEYTRVYARCLALALRKPAALEAETPEEALTDDLIAVVWPAMSAGVTRDAVEAVVYNVLDGWSPNDAEVQA